MNSIQYIVNCTVQCTMRCTAYYSVQSILKYHIHFTGCGKGVVLFEISLFSKPLVCLSTIVVQYNVQCIVQYTVQCIIQYSVQCIVQYTVQCIVSTAQVCRVSRHSLSCNQPTSKVKTSSCISKMLVLKQMQYWCFERQIWQQISGTSDPMYRGQPKHFF